jgi:HAD superfamily hydrolase (TIGR01509 family)
MPIAVIFDVDGTLIDSVDLHAKAWQDAFREFGHEVAFDKLRGQIGKGGDQLVPVFLSKDEADSTGEALNERRSEIFKQRYLRDAKPFPMVRELLERIRADGMRIALASSAKQDELEAYKKAARVEDLLQAETSADDAEKSKPNPDIFQAAMQRLGNVDPAQVIVVGDTPYDAEAAGKAGLRAVGVLCGGWPADALERTGCVATYREPGGPPGALRRLAACPLSGELHLVQCHHARRAVLHRMG